MVVTIFLIFCSRYYRSKAIGRAVDLQAKSFDLALPAVASPLQTKLAFYSVQLVYCCTSRIHKRTAKYALRPPYTGPTVWTDIIVCLFLASAVHNTRLEAYVLGSAVRPSVRVFSEITLRVME